MAKPKKLKNLASDLKEVSSLSADLAKPIVVKYYDNDKIVDYPKNNLDISDTTDLEKSISEVGFTSVLEVTTFEQPEGQVMILAGHRRRMAGLKHGMKRFPCTTKDDFNSWDEVRNYVLSQNNAHRDSAKSPLYYFYLYLSNAEYLREINFPENKMREELAERLGMTIPSIDRFKTLSHVIRPILDMVENELVGMSSVLPIGSHNETEQAQIYDIMQDALTDGESLTRETVKKIVYCFRDGFKTWNEIEKILRPRNIAPTEVSDRHQLAVPSDVDTADTDTDDTEDEAAEAGDEESGGEDETPDIHTDTDTETPSEDDEEPEDESSDEVEEEAAGDTSEPNDPQSGESSSDNNESSSLESVGGHENTEVFVRSRKVTSALEKMNTTFGSIYNFSDKDEARTALKEIAEPLEVVFAELKSIASENGIEDALDEILEALKK